MTMDSDTRLYYERRAKGLCTVCEDPADKWKDGRTKALCRECARLNSNRINEARQSKLHARERNIQEYYRGLRGRIA